MRLGLHPRFQKRVRKLSTAERAQVSSALRALIDGFGRPHHHAGLGIRRLRKDLFECRSGRNRRIVFLAEKNLLTAYDLMTHDEIQAWLRSF